MTRILLIRHGSTDLLREYLCGRTPGISLNQEGREEALKLAHFLFEQRKLDAVYSSPVERALETARIIALPHNLPVAVDANITELDFGTWVGARFGDLEKEPQWREYNRSRSLSSAPDGESLLEVQARAAKSLRTIAAAHQNQTVGLVTHGDVIRALLVLLLGMQLDDILRLEIRPSSFSEISVGADGPVVHSINRTSSF